MTNTPEPTQQTNPEAASEKNLELAHLDDELTEEQRWRLILGRYAERQFPLSKKLVAADGALAFLYDREHQARGAYGHQTSGSGAGRSAGFGESAPYIVDWLDTVRQVFPKETCEVVTHHALDKYGLTEVLNDPDVLAAMAPTTELAKTLLLTSRHASVTVVPGIRRVIAAVVAELTKKLSEPVRQAVTGRVERFKHSPLPVATNFDVWGTIKANLRHYDPASQRIVVQHPKFFARNALAVQWDIILLIDQSGSMAGSVLHAAVLAGILAGVPSYRLKIVVFDTACVDLTGLNADPVELLMKVQLGGGTDIGQAVRFAAGLVERPDKTVVALISDFYEGGSPGALLRAVQSLIEDRVTMIGLAALDEDCAVAYDKTMAASLVELGMPVAALTPRQLAHWLGEVTGR